MQEVLRIRIAGQPQPRGSKQAMPLYRSPREDRRPVRRTGPDVRVVCEACGETNGAIIVNVIDDNPESTAWIETVREAVSEHLDYPPEPLLAQGVAAALEFRFHLRRPQGDWGTGRNAHLLRDRADALPVVRPDLDKLHRGTQDALRGLAFHDDGQVTKYSVEKVYAVPDADDDGEGVEIVVYRRDEQRAGQLPMAERVRRFRVDSDPDRPADEHQLALG